MKKTFSLFVIIQILWIVQLNGQDVYQTLSTSFSPSDTMLIITLDSTNILWQLGNPNKPFFKGSYNDSFSIVTDTINPYGNKLESSFTVSVSPKTPNFHFPFPCYLGLYGGIRIEFKHRFNCDLINDYGKIDFSLDSGQNWYCLNSPKYNFNGKYGYPNFDDSNNIHIFSNKTLTDSISITGNSGDWVSSRFTKDLHYIGYHVSPFPCWRFFLLKVT